ncbi:MAG: hypothetical protein GXX93_01885 [Anaerolineae bacterium]|nr:hypothetical protein [Anaerolineae bacterium]
MHKITITAGSVTAEATLKDTPTANALWEALPIKGRGNTWGEEIYFSIPVRAGLEPGADEVVELGDIAYWPPGSAFCIFFGSTPVSGPGEVRAASPVNVMGKLEGDPKVFKQVPNGATVTIERA